MLTGSVTRNLQNSRYFRCPVWKTKCWWKSKLTRKLKHTNSILEYFEYFCQMSSKSILIISSYTVSKLTHFLRHSVVMLCCKKTYLYNLLCVVDSFIFLTTSKPGGFCIWNHITLSYLKIIKQYLALIWGDWKGGNGKRRTGKRGTKLQGWKRQDWKTREHDLYG